MTPNDDLARWGEPPADHAELALADWLADYIDSPAEPAPAGKRRTALSWLLPARTSDCSRPAAGSTR